MRRLALGAAALLAIACVKSSGPRELRPQVEETVSAPPSVVFQAALKAVSDQGLPLREAEPATRVIQTNYVDITSYEPLSASQYPATERQVRFRIMVAPDQSGAGSVIAIIGLYAPFRTGYSTSERNEREIPRDHPGMTIIRRIQRDVLRAAGQ